MFKNVEQPKINKSAILGRTKVIILNVAMTIALFEGLDMKSFIR